MDALVSTNRDLIRLLTAYVRVDPPTSVVEKHKNFAEASRASVRNTEPRDLVKEM